MLIRQFRKATNRDWESDGWLMKGAPSTYYPIGGMGVAHDLLEHRRNDEGTIRDELLAFGAMLFVRGDGCYWERKHSAVPPGGHLGGELAADLGIKFKGIEDGIPDPGRTQRLDEYVEEWIDQAISTARKEIEATEFVLSEDVTDSHIQEFLTRSRGWLRRGYRMARRRYQNIDSYTLSTLFTEIEKKADAFLSDDMANYCPMIVRLDLQRARVQVYLDDSRIEWN